MKNKIQDWTSKDVETLPDFKNAQSDTEEVIDKELEAKYLEMRKN